MNVVADFLKFEGRALLARCDTEANTVLSILKKDAFFKTAALPANNEEDPLPQTIHFVVSK